MSDNGQLALAQAVLGGTSIDSGTVMNAAFGRLAKGIASVSSTGAITWQNCVENVVSGQGATATLTAAQSGSTVLFDRPAGIVYTLPPPVVGMYFACVITASITSNNAKIITDAGTTLLIGSVFNAVAAGTGTEFIANGSTHIAMTQNGTTSGGLIGSMFWLNCVSTTLWAVSGTILGSGTIITPFATS